MKSTIERLQALLQDEYELAGFRQNDLTAERLSECLTLLDAILRPVNVLRGEGELLDIVLSNALHRHNDAGGDLDEDTTGARIQLLINANEAMEGTG